MRTYFPLLRTALQAAIKPLQPMPSNWGGVGRRMSPTENRQQRVRQDQGPALPADSGGEFRISCRKTEGMLRYKKQCKGWEMYEEIIDNYMQCHNGFLFEFHLLCMQLLSQAYC